jgi:hypothetical protein
VVGADYDAAAGEGDTGYEQDESEAEEQADEETSNAAFAEFSRPCEAADECGKEEHGDYAGNETEGIIHTKCMPQLSQVTVVCAKSAPREYDADSDEHQPDADCDAPGKELEGGFGHSQGNAKSKHKKHDYYGDEASHVTELRPGRG